MDGTKLRDSVVRIALWFGSLLVSASIFSLCFGGGFPFVLRATLTFALPVAILYLPLVFAFEDAVGRRMWILLITGASIGPASLLLLAIIQQLRGVDAHSIWQGDGEGLSVISAMLCALIVGSMTTVIYVAALKFIHLLSKTRG